MASMTIELLLFTSDPALARRARAAGIGGFVLDWESRGKERRQQGADTEINRDTPADVARIATVADARRVVRVNALGPWTASEIRAAIDAGATDLLLPMVRTPTDVERFLTMVGGRVRAGILVETVSACRHAAELATLPLDLVYVGLNDLSIDRGSDTIFEPLRDGLALELRAHFAGVPFGLGGLTVVDGGRPIACLDLMAELRRVGCDFTFLRRSFHRDTAGRDLGVEVARMQAQWARLGRRTPAEIDADHRRFVATHFAADGARATLSELSR